LDLRIDDRDSITITRWSGLSLESVLRILGVALAESAIERAISARSRTAGRSVPNVSQCVT
jgi:hypothetical protein